MRSCRTMLNRAASRTSLRRQRRGNATFAFHSADKDQSDQPYSAIRTSTDRSARPHPGQQAHQVTRSAGGEPRSPLIRPGVFRAVWVTVGFLTLLCLSDTALAASQPGVPPSGELAGETSSYWLKRSWQTVFNTSAPVDPCQWSTAHGHGYRCLTLTTVAPGTDTYCGRAAGQPTYVVGLSNQCSTFHKDRGTFGTTDPRSSGALERFRGRAPNHDDRRPTA